MNSGDSKNNQLQNSGHSAQYSQLDVVQRAEKPFVELSEMLNGFAGYHLDKDGNLVVLVKDLSNPDNIKQTVRSYVNNRYSKSGMQFNSTQIVLKKAVFSFKELQSWRDQIRNPLINTDGVLSIDLAEDKNVLRIGVNSETVIPEIKSIVYEYKIPEQSIDTYITSKPTSLSSSKPPESNSRPFFFSSTLEDDIRPLTGGLELTRYEPSTGQHQFGTITFVALRQGQPVIVTASHVTVDSDDGSIWTVYPAHEYYQSNRFATSQIGSEIFDPYGWSCGWIINPKECRKSDSAVIELDGSVNYEIGTIAKTLGRGVDWQPGSKTIDPNMPRFRIISDDKDILVNMPLNKMGKTSGWTNGWVTSTCVDVLSGQGSGNVWYTCQGRVYKMYAANEDSGAPVFYDHTTPYGDVELVGLAWSINATEQYTNFSPMYRIFQELGNMIVADPPISVNIQGPGFIGESGLYNWSANVDEAEGSVSYQWSIKWEGTSTWNNLGTNSSQSISINNEDNFQLRVQVDDAIESALDIRDITVDFDCDPQIDPCIE